MKSKLVIGAAVLLFGTGCALVGGTVGVRSMYEAPPYTVLDELPGDVEVREYGTRLAAEAVMPMDDNEEPEDDAFRVLFDYISGENRAQQKIAMTVPVETEARDSEKISMTTPVETYETGDSYSMRFFMPSKYTMETAPVPTDERVKLIELPGETVAVTRFSGTAGDGSVKRREQRLFDSLEGSGWEPVGEPALYRYDPPFALPFARRNEVVVRVQKMN